MDILVICYGVVLNAMTFLVYGIDKWAAKQEFRRIPERVLLGLAIVGGAVGAFVGMRIFRHKTRKAKFYIGIPVLLFLQVCIGIWILLIF